MFRSLSRTAIATAVALTMIFAVVPAAEASPFELARSSGNWLDLAWSWLSGLLAGPQDSQPKSAMEASKPVDNDGGLGGYGTLSGSCLDPEGRPKPCF